MKYEFQKSIELALADFDPNYKERCQVFSFCWYKGKLAAMGKNDSRTHPLNLINGFKYNYNESKGSCSELRMFLKLKNTTNIPFNKVTIINIRVDRNKQIKMSRPCKFCYSLIRYINPKNLYFTNDLGEFEEYQITA